ncbi:SpoIIIAH-like family protein [Eubacterium sp.]|jgi:stage III sporulation protein AH|uniref:SpoIIIAH-like family protein n=1 Tax=Eubacterium sp. TaxID=142586 RepID=UPI001D98AA21|nr:SpoIIIAH-like family protein [Eubacterium sp.]MBS5619403.1 SpoIIIAH-like family protein [Eubacterium sp.]
MKKILKKNQFIVTFLAVLIAVAGYLNYSANLDKKNESKKVTNDTYESIYSKDNLLTNNEDIESMDKEETTEEPGAAVLTNGSTLSSYMVQAKLNREQTRSKNKETLLEVINNNDIGDKEKKKAVKSMVKITENSEMENNIETLLKAKGFNDIIVTINDNQADVILSDTEVSEEKRAQIEDVIKRKTNISVNNITITPAK